MKIEIRRLSGGMGHICLVDAITGEALPHQKKCEIFQTPGNPTEILVTFNCAPGGIPFSVKDGPTPTLMDMRNYEFA